MRIKLAYGHNGLWVDIPGGVPTTVIEPIYVPGLADEEASLLSAMRSPLAGLPLRDIVRASDTVAVVFSDITRPMPNDRVLPPLLNELLWIGVPDSRVILINALGTHRAQTREELMTMLGPGIMNRYSIVQHDAWGHDLVEVTRNRSGNSVRINRYYMEADKKLLTGFVEPHFFAGFSGGPKAVFPGIANIDAIMDNHGAQMLSYPDATWVKTVGNPLWEEIRDIALATDPAFILNVTLNKDHAITGVFAGEMMRAHQAATTFVRENAMQPVQELYDIVLTSNSGYPLDLNLYQAVKGMSAASQIVKPGGDIIIVAECWDGLPSHGEYAHMLKQADSAEDLLDKIMAPGFRSHDQWQAQIQAQIQRKARVHVHTDGLEEDELRQALVLPSTSVEKTLDELLRETPDARIAVLPEGPQTVPYVTEM
jgi:nickel-dependent lactate racemase